MIRNILMANRHQIYNHHVEAIMEGKGLCHLYSHRLRAIGMNSLCNQSATSMAAT